MGAIAWGFWIALAWLLFVAVAVAQPAELQAVKHAVDDRIKYRNYKGWDWTYIRPDSWGYGNCAVHAYTYWRDLLASHPEAEIGYCVLPDGQGHTFTTVGPWVLDNRESQVVKQGENCK